MGKKVEKLIVVIAQSKKNPGHGVVWTGNSSYWCVNAQLLSAFSTVEQLAEAEPEAYAYGIGSEIAQSIHQWFRIPANQT